MLRCTKNARLFALFLIVFLLVFLFIVGEYFISKLKNHKFTVPCTLCPSKDNLTNSSELLQFRINQHHLPNPSSAINVLLFFIHGKKNYKLKANLNQCISSLFTVSSSPLYVHIITDPQSVLLAVQVLEQSAPLTKTSIQVSLYDVNSLLKPLQGLIDSLRPHFSFKHGAYYNDRLFYLSIGLYKVMPLQKIILVDADVKFLDDVANLHQHFEQFPVDAVIGIANEQQPVYMHVLSRYRQFHNDSRIGGPPPHGIPGFNSGVLLLDLEGMRNSVMYKEITNNNSMTLRLVEKYQFKGHLGDQDFYTLINLEYPGLFYTIPCNWNRQLCQWWRYHGYKDVFDSFYTCEGKVQLWHGNCNSKIPYS